MEAAAKSRTEYSTKNTIVSLISRMLAIFMGFVVRVVFTHTLSESYVGINGLFTDILNVLSLSELGVGTAVTYALYRPIAEKDIEKQKSLMKMYQGFYRIVAAIVLAAGLLVIPFMDVLIKNRPDVGHLTLIYLMYLANSVVSYLMIYKRTLIDAHQMLYVGTLYQTIFFLLQDVIQIILLLTTGNFILFLSVYLLCTFGSNLCISAKADRLYPFLKSKEIRPLPKAEKKGIFRSIRAMLMHKIGTVVVNNTDNLLLSSIVGIVSVGLYSNYYLLIGSVRQVLNQIFTGITASVGNLGVTEDEARVKKIFETSFFVGQWIYGFAAICLYELLNPFVEISFGAKYVFPASVVLILCINFFVTGMRKATLVFRDSMGLFWYDRYKSIAEAVINLTASIVLARQFGTAGVFWGTFVSTVTTSLWVEPYVLYHYKLHASVVPYLKKYSVYSAVVAGLWFLTDRVCRRVTGSLWTVLGGRLLICLLLPNLCMLLIYSRTWEFRFLAEKAKTVLRWKRKPAQTRAPEGGRETGREETCLLALLKEAIRTDNPQPLSEQNLQLPETAIKKELESAGGTDVEWEKFLQLAGQHGVSALLYDELVTKKRLPAQYQKAYERKCHQTVLQSYRLLFLSRAVIELLKQQGIPALVLKGTGIAGCYPVPELRKSGDVDILLLKPEQIREACEVLEAAGFSRDVQQLSLHHVAVLSPEQIEVELHTLLAEPFDDRRINRYMQERMRADSVHVVWEPVMGVPLPRLSDGEQAYALLLHMLQHYLRAGFGLKLLCDWTVFWNHPHGRETEECYLRLVRESGLEGFSDMVTAVCVCYLGLKKEQTAFMFGKSGKMFPDMQDTKAFLEEIMDGGEFGRNERNRMVTLRGTGIRACACEFHHQMKLNYPKAGSVVLLWPALWLMTLLRFWQNNRTVRHISTGALLKNARQRGRLTEKMRLFEQTSEQTVKIQ
jgi:O-antigen/teichoic acid export membrane protein